MCKVTASAIQQDAAALAKAVNSIATALVTTDPTLSKELSAAAATLVTATANWTTGSAIADINDAAQAIEALLGAIPLTAPDAVFVGIAVAALDILIANLSTQPVQTTNTIANARAVLAHVDTLPTNHWRGTAQIHRHIFEGPRAAFVGTWNDQVNKQPLPGFSKLS
jgi:hypothetical protein